MPTFDIIAAKNAGYSDSEIADFMGSKFGYDSAAARSAGYSDSEIIGQLSSRVELGTETAAAITPEMLPSHSRPWSNGGDRQAVQGIASPAGRAQAAQAKKPFVAFAEAIPSGAAKIADTGAALIGSFAENPETSLASKVQRNITEPAIKYWEDRKTPEPLPTIGQQVGESLGELAPTLLLGPAALPAMAATATYQTGKDLLEADLPVEVAQNAAAIQGLGAAAMGAIPGAAPTLGKSALLALTNPVTGIAQRAATREYLEPYNPQVAEGFNPTDPAALVMDVAMAIPGMAQHPRLRAIRDADLLSRPADPVQPRAEQPTRPQADPAQDPAQEEAVRQHNQQAAQTQAARQAAMAQGQTAQQEAARYVGSRVEQIFETPQGKETVRWRPGKQGGIEVTTTSPTANGRSKSVDVMTLPELADYLKSKDVVLREQFNRTEGVIPNEKDAEGQQEADANGGYEGEKGQLLTARQGVGREPNAQAETMVQPTVETVGAAVPPVEGVAVSGQSRLQKLKRDLIKAKSAPEPKATDKTIMINGQEVNLQEVNRGKRAQKIKDIEAKIAEEATRNDRQGGEQAEVVGTVRDGQEPGGTVPDEAGGRGPAEPSGPVRDGLPAETAPTEAGRTGETETAGETSPLTETGGGQVITKEQLDKGLKKLADATAGKETIIPPRYLKENDAVERAVREAVNEWKALDITPDVVSVPLSELRSTQNWAAPERIAGMMEEWQRKGRYPGGTKGSRPEVYGWKGKLYVYDGNHRAAAAELLGLKNIDAAYVNLTPDIPTILNDRRPGKITPLTNESIADTLPEKNAGGDAVRQESLLETPTQPTGKSVWNVEYYPRGSDEKLTFQVSADTEAVARTLAREGVKEKGGGTAFTMEPTTPASERPSKPRLAETPDDLYKAIVKATDEGVVTDKGIRYPVVRLVAGGGDYRVSSKGIEKIENGGVTATPATEAQIRDVHHAIDTDTAQVIVRSNWGGSGRDVSARDLSELHNPSGNSFGKQTAERQHAKGYVEPVEEPAATPTKPLRMDGTTRPVKPTKPAAPPLPQKSIDLFNTALAARDTAKLKEMVHPDNKSWRRMFEEATGEKLPMGVTASGKVVDRWAGAQAETVTSHTRERILEEIDAWRSGQKATKGQPSTGEKYALVMRENIKRLEKQLADLDKTATPKPESVAATPKAEIRDADMYAKVPDKVKAAYNRLAADQPAVLSMAASGEWRIDTPAEQMRYSEDGGVTTSAGYSDNNPFRLAHGITIAVSEKAAAIETERIAARDRQAEAIRKQKEAGEAEQRRVNDLRNALETRLKAEMPGKFKKGEFTTIKGDGSKGQAVEAEIYGPLAVHRAIGNKSKAYTISHTPTGAAINSDRFTNATDAKRAALRILEVEPELANLIDPKKLNKLPNFEKLRDLSIALNSGDYLAAPEIRGAAAPDRPPPKPPTGGRNSHADTGGYAERTPPTRETTQTFIELPEMVKLYKAINEGKTPLLADQLGKALGRFTHRPDGTADIKLRKDLFAGPEVARETVKAPLSKTDWEKWQDTVREANPDADIIFRQGRPAKGKVDLVAYKRDPNFVLKVFAHEIGHNVDFLPDAMVQGRGNILGHVAALKRYMKDTLEMYPDAKGKALTDEDIARLREEAKDGGGDILETITREVPKYEAVGITPEMITEIWNGVGDARTTTPELYKFIAKLSDAEKKAIVVQAMKGVVDERLQKFGGRRQVGTETVTEEVRKPGNLRQRFDELFRAEVEKRRLYERDVIMKELKALTQTWKPFDPAADAGYTKYRHSPAELYADAVSVLFNEPQLLKDTAPTFYKSFFYYMGERPAFKEAYTAISRLSKDPEALGVDRYAEEMEMYQRGAEKAEELRKAEKPYENVYDTAMRWLVDKNHDVLKNLPDTPEGQAARHHLEEVQYIGGNVEGYVRQADAIRKDVQTAGLTIDDLSAYMLAKHVIENRSDIANTMGKTAATEQAKLDWMRKTFGDEKFATLEKAAEDFRGARQQVIDKMEESGIVTPDLLETIQERQDYAHIDVQKYMDDKYGGGTAAGAGWKKLAEGTLSDINNVYVATVLQDMAILRMAKINEAKTALADVFASKGLATMAEMRFDQNVKARRPVEPGGGKAILTILREGKPEYYVVDKHVADTFKYNPIKAMAIGKIANTVQQVVRDILISKNPAWMARNLYRDYKGTVKNNPEIAWWNPADRLRLLKAYKEAFSETRADVMKNQRSADIEQMHKDYMLNTDRMFADREMNFENELERIAYEFQFDGEQSANRAVAAAKKFYAYLDKWGKISEQTSKVAGYKLLKGKGLAGQDLGHRVRTRIGTPDYRRQGALQQLTNNIFMFSNVNKEGVRSAIESFKSDPMSYVFKTVENNVLPKLMLGLAAAGVFGDDLKELVSKIPSWDRRSYTVIPIPDEMTDWAKEAGVIGKDATAYLRLPQDYEGQFFGALAYDMAQADLKGALKDTRSANPYRLHPVLDLAFDWAQYMAGGNPQDDFRQKDVLTKEEQKYAEVKGPFNTKSLAGMGVHSFNTILGPVYKMDTREFPREQTPLEYVLKAHPLNAIGTYVMITDAGKQEQLIKKVIDTRNEKAIQSFERGDRINEAVRQGKTSTGEQMALYREMRKDKLFSPSTYSPGQFMRQFRGAMDQKKYGIKPQSRKESGILRQGESP